MFHSDPNIVNQTKQLGSSEKGGTNCFMLNNNNYCMSSLNEVYPCTTNSKIVSFVDQTGFRVSRLEKKSLYKYDNLSPDLSLYEC